jgi:hypothetical protein
MRLAMRRWPRYLRGVMSSHNQFAMSRWRHPQCFGAPLLALALVSLIGLGSLRGAEPAAVSPEEDMATPEPFGCPQKPFTKSKRLARITESGGVPEIEDAVTKALQSLNRTQQPDGSWPGGPGMTALAVLAYLGQGEAMMSPEFGEPCLKGIVALIDLATKNDGHFSSTPGDKSYSHDHGIATYALAEAAVWCKRVRFDIPKLDDTVRQAGQFIIDHQHTGGGWEQGYEKTGDGGGDLGITAWQLMALRACFLTKLDFRDLPPCVVRSLKFIESLQIESGAFACRPNAPPDAAHRSLTGAAILCFQIWQKGNSSVPRHGAKFCSENSKFDYHGETADLYGHFFESQAMINRGGEQWKHYRALTLNQLLENQNPDGSWKAPGGGTKVRTLAPDAIANAHQRTCLCVLMLEIYYHYLTTIPQIRIERGG